METWKTDGLFKADAEKVAAELRDLSVLTPENIVEFARNNPDSETYKCFTWDDTEAAEKWRLQEARMICCQIVYVDDDLGNDPVEIPVHFVNKREFEHVGDHYEHIDMIMSKADDYQILLEECADALRALKNKYSYLIEYKDIWDRIH